MTNPTLWDEVLGEVERRIGTAAEIWLRDVVLVDADREEVVLAVPTRLARTRFEGRIGEAVAKAFECLLGVRPALRVEVDPSLVSEGLKQARSSSHELQSLSDAAARVKVREARIAQPARAASPDAEMSAERFVVGACNRTAFRASERILEAPGEVYNPLVVTGPDGCGKTHLLTIIAHGLAAKGTRNVLFATAEDFANQYVAGIRSNQTERFRERYRRVDAVVIDDVHLLSGRQKTQIEFLHRFEELLHAGKQIVVSSEESPKRVHMLHPGLAGRLLGGLVVDLEPPNLETRRAILLSLCRLHGVPLSREVVSFVARHLTRNARDLVGAVARLEAAAKIGERIDVPLAKRRLEDLCVAHPKTPPEEVLLEIVAERCGVPAAEILAGSRRQGAARARQIAIYLIRQLTALSITEVARFVRREPSTVTFAEAKVGRLLVCDDALERLLESCRRRYDERK